jgi:hypothetical protein
MNELIVANDFPGLGSLCWNRSKTAPIDREIAWGLYRANWRFIYQDDLAAEEIDLIESLEAEFGERLLGTEGPPPPFARMITPEQAAEILGIELELLERRIRAEVLPFREIDGKITFNLVGVLDLKQVEAARDKLMVEICEDMEGQGKRVEMITPEQAAEILGVDEVLLDHWLEVGVLACRQVGGNVSFSLAEVLELKKTQGMQNAALLEASRLMESLETPPKFRK